MFTLMFDFTFNVLMVMLSLLMSLWPSVVKSAAKNYKDKHYILVMLLTEYHSIVPSTVLLLQVTENMSVNIDLSCGNYEDEISWRLNGNPLKAHGNMIQTTVGYMKGGNYTCHNNAGDVLNHTLVLQQGIGYQNSILVKSQKSSGNQSLRVEGNIHSYGHL